MGIPQILDIIREHEEIVPIAQLAEEHYERHGKPFRIAVDEADWRFNNVTQAFVYAIQNDSELAYQGIEKLMFQRICRFLTLNIQLIFVFDGPGRPWKRGCRGGGKIDYRQRDLLKDVLKHFGVPYHEAPGEAEAECARMQILGMVDAVWSQDSDCLMFGCTLWIRDDRVVKEKGTKDRSKENTQKSKKTARVVKAQHLRDRLKIDREGLVLFAMLVGGDYDTKGLPGCGPSMAVRMIKKGLGQSLCACRSQRDCDAWSILMIDGLHSSGGRAIDIPPRFPNFKTLVKYNSPKITGDEVLLNNAKLNLDNMWPINELKLLEVTSSRFNKWGRDYMNWVGPVLLTRALMNRNSTLPREVVHGIKLVNERAKKTDNGLPARVFERKLSFSPFGVTALQRKDFEGERLGYWSGKAEDLFDPDFRVKDRELPMYWLRKVLPPDVLDPPPVEPKRKPAKRKKQDDATEASDPSATTKKQKKAPKASDSPAVAKRPRKTATSSSTPDTFPKKTPSKQRPENPNAPIVEKNIEIIELSDSDSELRLPPPRSIPKSSARSIAAQVTDFGSPSSSETETNVTQLAAVARRPGQETPSRNNLHWRSPSYEDDERDLQLALRLSMQEPDVASSPRPISENDDRASFALPPLEDESAFMPYRSLATSARESNPNPPSKIARQPEGIRRPTPTKSLDHGLSATRPPPPGSSGFPSSASSFQTLPILPAPIHEEPVSPKRSEGGTSGPNSLTAEQVRIARLRHFQMPANASPTIPPSTTPGRSHATPTRTARSTYNVPAEVDCIDLTDD